MLTEKLFAGPLVGRAGFFGQEGPITTVEVVRFHSPLIRAPNLREFVTHAYIIGARVHVVNRYLYGVSNYL